MSARPAATAGVRRDDIESRSIVLASGSETRAKLLQAAGVPFLVDPAAVDEAEVKHSLRHAGVSAADMADHLAELKARQVGRRHPGRTVIGADQVLECDGKDFAKPADLAAARRQLQELRGKCHALLTAVVAMRDDTRLWHHRDRSVLTMRPFTDEFLDGYLKAAGASALQSVGAYQLEGLGAQLFAGVQGDHFAILGLPLLPLLHFLRENREIPA